MDTPDRDYREWKRQLSARIQVCMSEVEMFHGRPELVEVSQTIRELVRGFLIMFAQLQMPVYSD